MILLQQQLLNKQQQQQQRLKSWQHSLHSSYQLLSQLQLRHASSSKSSSSDSQHSLRWLLQLRLVQQAVHSGAWTAKSGRCKQTAGTLQDNIPLLLLLPLLLLVLLLDLMLWRR
jgi:hypothetical protein